MTYDGCVLSTPIHLIKSHHFEFLAPQENKNNPKLGRPLGFGPEGRPPSPLGSPISVTNRTLPATAVISGFAP